ncbi:MAG: homoserine dehydrogenase, partial [Rhodanobacter sp.]
KLVILAREAGWPLSLEDVDLESLVPAALAALPRDEFMQRLDELDAPMAAKLAVAHAEGGVLRHVAKLDRHGRASVRLQVLPASHAFAHTRLTDNIVQFTTRRYCDNPLSVQGPGAGPEVTAAGVFTDLLRIAESLEARA